MLTRADEVLAKVAEMARSGETVIVMSSSKAGRDRLRTRFLVRHGGQPWERRVQFIDPDATGAQPVEWLHPVWALWMPDDA